MEIFTTVAWAVHHTGPRTPRYSAGNTQGKSAWVNVLSSCTVGVCLFLTLLCLLFLCEQEVMSGCGGAVQQVEQRRRLQRKQDLTGTLTDSSSAEWIHGLSTQRYRDIYNLVLRPSVLAALSSCQHAVRFHLQQVQRPSAFPQYTVTDISPSCPAHSHQPIATEHCVN